LIYMTITSNQAEIWASRQRYMDFWPVLTTKICFW
jgi:hypothetical protein